MFVETSFIMHPLLFKEKKKKKKLTPVLTGYFIVLQRLYISSKSTIALIFYHGMDICLTF